VSYVKLVQETGLLLILRPGPYNFCLITCTFFYRSFSVLLLLSASGFENVESRRHAVSKMYEKLIVWKFIFVFSGPYICAEWEFVSTMDDNNISSSNATNEKCIKLSYPIKKASMQLVENFALTTDSVLTTLIICRAILRLLRHIWLYRPSNQPAKWTLYLSVSS
jgi:hypothetical protein